MTVDHKDADNLQSAVCSGHAVPSFHSAPSIIVNSKQVKNLPIYQNFFKEFLPDWAATPVWVLGSLPVQAKTRSLPILVQLS